MRRTARGGFTLVELLVIFAIIGILIALLLPATRRVRDAPERIKCQNNLKQLILACHNYESMRSSQPNGSSDVFAAHSFPPGCIGPGATPEERLSWMVALLPYLEQDSLYRQLDLEKGYSGNL